MSFIADRLGCKTEIRPGIWNMFTLVFIESVIIFSWTLLAATLLSLIFDYYYEFFPFCYLFAAFLLSWIEHHGSRNSQGISPLEVIYSIEITHRNKLPSQWQSFRRLFFTPILAIPLGIGFIHTRTGHSLINAVSGTRIVKIDKGANPTPAHELKMFHYSAILKVTGYTFFSAAISIVILFASLQQEPCAETSVIDIPGHLSQHDEELLAEYLLLSATFPDSLEFHVRLSSLYYRNDMTGDLICELEEVYRLNPEHPILLLADDFDITFTDLETLPDSIVDSTADDDMNDTSSVQEDFTANDDMDDTSSVQEDSTANDDMDDTSSVQEDSISLKDLSRNDDSLATDSDTLIVVPDSLHFGIDTPETIREPFFPTDTTSQNENVITPDSVEILPLSNESQTDTIITDD